MKGSIQIYDNGPKPDVFNINKAAKRNTYYRTALWTGCNLQVTLMILHSLYLQVSGII